MPDPKTHNKDTCLPCARSKTHDKGLSPIYLLRLSPAASASSRAARKWGTKRYCRRVQRSLHMDLHFVISPLSYLIFCILCRILRPTIRSFHGSTLHHSSPSARLLRSSAPPSPSHCHNLPRAWGSSTLSRTTEGLQTQADAAPSTSLSPH